MGDCHSHGSSLLNMEMNCGSHDSADQPNSERYERSFVPTCDAVGELIPNFTCGEVNAATYACPAGLECTEKGCCEKEDPTVCYAYVNIEDATIHVGWPAFSH